MARGHVSEFQQRLHDQRDAAPMRSVCGVCGEAFEGPAGECRELMREHRRQRHPELPATPTPAKKLMDEQKRQEKAAEAAARAEAKRVAAEKLPKKPGRKLVEKLSREKKPRVERQWLAHACPLCNGAVDLLTGECASCGVMIPLTPAPAAEFEVFKQGRGWRSEAVESQLEALYQEHVAGKSVRRISEERYAEFGFGSVGSMAVSMSKLLAARGWPVIIRRGGRALPAEKRKGVRDEQFAIVVDRNLRGESVWAIAKALYEEWGYRSQKELAARLYARFDRDGVQRIAYFKVPPVPLVLLPEARLAVAKELYDGGLTYGMIAHLAWEKWGYLNSQSCKIALTKRFNQLGWGLGRAGPMVETPVFNRAEAVALIESAG